MRQRLLLAAFLILTLLAGDNYTLAGEAPPPSVTLIKPEKRTVIRWIKLPGSAEVDAEIMLYAKVSGYLKDFTLDVGDKVKPGQVVGKLDAPEIEQDIKLAEAQLAAAEIDAKYAEIQVQRAQIRGTEVDAKQITLTTELSKVKVEAERARKQCERTQKLHASNAATEQELEQQDYACQALDAAVKTAESKIAALKPERELLVKDVEVLKAAVQSANGKAAIARAALGKAHVWAAYYELSVPQVGSRAGATATVTKRFVSNGDLIAGGAAARSGVQPLVTLAVTDPIRIVADVPESECPRIDKGSDALISLYALPKEKPLTAKVSRTSNELAAASRTLRVELDVPNPKGTIRTGMMANVELAVDAHPNVLAVPASAVEITKQGALVYTVDAGKAKKMPVTVGFNDHGWIEISAQSLNESAALIKDVKMGIADGTPVTVKE